MSVARPLGEASDETLVTRVLAGDRGAFELLYARYVRRVYRFIDRRLSNRADVEETTQEVFIAVFSSLDSFRGDAPFAAWVLGIARRTVASRFKKRQHPTVPLDSHERDDGEAASPGEVASPDSDPHALYEFQERLRELEDRAMRRLSADQRQLFTEHHLEHRSIAEIAEAQGKSADSIKSNLYRARRLLFSR